MKWTRVINTPLAAEAWEVIGNTECDYHNGLHVMKMYEYLDKTNEPYDEALDWAVLFHDIVYDNQPEKELRSAKMFASMVGEYEGSTLSPSGEAHVHSLIMRTVDHIVHPSVNRSSAIIRADLHALTNPIDVVYNYMSIMEESIELYDIDEITFAENNIKFMTGLWGRVDKNIEIDPAHREFYKDVKRGIVSTINLSIIIKGDL